MRIIAAVVCGLAAFFMGGEFVVGGPSRLYSKYWVFATLSLGAIISVAIFLKGCAFLRRRPIGSTGFSHVLLWFIAYTSGGSVGPIWLNSDIVRYSFETKMDFEEFNQFLSTEFPQKYHLNFGPESYVSVRRAHADALSDLFESRNITHTKR